MNKIIGIWGVSILLIIACVVVEQSRKLYSFYTVPLNFSITLSLRYHYYDKREEITLAMLIVQIYLFATNFIIGPNFSFFAGTSGVVFTCLVGIVGLLSEKIQDFFRTDLNSILGKFSPRVSPHGRVEEQEDELLFRKKQKEEIFSKPQFEIEIEPLETKKSKEAEPVPKLSINKRRKPLPLLTLFLRLFFVLEALICTFCIPLDGKDTYTSS